MLKSFVLELISVCVVFIVHVVPKRNSAIGKRFYIDIVTVNTMDFCTCKESPSTIHGSSL